MPLKGKPGHENSKKYFWKPSWRRNQPDAVSLADNPLLSTGWGPHLLWVVPQFCSVYLSLHCLYYNSSKILEKTLGHSRILWLKTLYWLADESLNCSALGHADSQNLYLCPLRCLYRNSSRISMFCSECTTTSSVLASRSVWLYLCTSWGEIGRVGSGHFYAFIHLSFYICVTIMPFYICHHHAHFLMSDEGYMLWYQVNASNNKNLYHGALVEA